jgi:outer membrane protein assembly factor BamB
MNRIVFLLSTFLLTVQDANADWSFWRGPEQTGVSREKDLPAEWSADPKAPLNFHWKAPYGCRATPIVMNGRVYINNQAGTGVSEQERVMCLDAKSGKVIWEKRFNVFQTDIVSVRLGWTNLVGDPKTGNVYWHGTQGFLICFDRDGKILWQHSLTEEYGRVSGYGGRLTSPIVDEDLLILGMANSSWGDQAKGNNRFVAFNKHNGDVVWWSEPATAPATYYSVPVIAVINGQRLLITGAADGWVYALQPRTGKKVWGFKLSKSALNSSPVVAGNMVYIGHGEENYGTSTQGRVVCLDASIIKDSEPKLVWERMGCKARYASPIIHDKRLYVFDEFAQLWCFDGTKGKLLWRFPYGRNARGSGVWADGKIYVAEVNGKFHILQPSDTKCVRLHEQEFVGADGSSEVELAGSPAVANGCVYFGTSEELYCIGKKGHTAKPDPIPPMPKEAAPLKEPAQLQLIPADVVMRSYPDKPGSAEFTAKLFDANGQFLRQVRSNEGINLTLPQPPPPPGAKTAPPALQGNLGSGNRDDLFIGVFFAAQKVPSQQGYIQATLGQLSTKCRVRVAPTLPYTMNIDKVPVGAAPAGWVQVQGRWKVAQLKDGSKVLAKVNTVPNPMIAQSYCYIGVPSDTEYTISTDVQGFKAHNDLPEMGLINNRYTLFLIGNTQQLRLVSWEAIPRIDRTISYSWKPGVWYSMKLTATVIGDKTIVRGKVWTREQPEPKEWTVELADPTPNREGAPGLYTYALGVAEEEPGTEVYYTNVRVQPNGKK